MGNHGQTLFNKDRSNDRNVTIRDAVAEGEVPIDQQVIWGIRKQNPTAIGIWASERYKRRVSGEDETTPPPAPPRKQQRHPCTQTLEASDHLHQNRNRSLLVAPREYGSKHRAGSDTHVQARQAARAPKTLPSAGLEAGHTWNASSTKRPVRTRALSLVRIPSIQDPPNSSV